MRLILGSYFLVISIWTFLAYAWDKRRAVRKGYRISEKNLLCLTILGGGFGAWLAGHFFHHKTRKWYFQLTWYLGIALDIGLFYLMWRI